MSKTRTFAVATFDSETDTLKSIYYGETFSTAKAAASLAKEKNDARTLTEVRTGEGDDVTVTFSAPIYYKAVEIDEAGEVVADK